jgi:hypothetical protein
MSNFGFSILYSVYANHRGLLLEFVFKSQQLTPIDNSMSKISSLFHAHRGNPHLQYLKHLLEKLLDLDKSKMFTAMYSNTAGKHVPKHLVRYKFGSKNFASTCGEPELVISLHSHHVSLVQWTTRLLPVMRDPGSNPRGVLV